MAAATQINIPRDRNMCQFIYCAINYRIAPGRFVRSSARSRSTGLCFNDRPGGPLYTYLVCSTFDWTICPFDLCASGWHCEFSAWNFFLPRGSLFSWNQNRGWQESRVPRLIKPESWNWNQTLTLSSWLLHYLVEVTHREDIYILVRGLCFKGVILGINCG